MEEFVAFGFKSVGANAVACALEVEPPEYSPSAAMRSESSALTSCPTDDCDEAPLEVEDADVTELVDDVEDADEAVEDVEPS